MRARADGALRGSKQSSGGMALYSYSTAGGKELLYRAGRLFHTVDSSFLAEALTLEWAIEILFTTILVDV